MSNNSFTLKSNAAFAQRQKNVFDQLRVLENNRKNLSHDENLPDFKETYKRNQRSITKHFRGKESIFKKPQNPAPKNYIFRIPDFKKNPHKWTKYSLDDVKDEDISEKGNTKAAMAFLKELKSRKASEMECDEVTDATPKKIIFQRHISTKSNGDDLKETKCSFKSSKIVMPEYVVGDKLKKEKKNRNIQCKGKELKLDHLHEADDE